jgi:ABC-type Fe3+/spermidine/putrescine transport system ATPase subunit
VAAFVGMPNLLPAKVREIRRESGATLARVDGDGWEGWCSAGDDVQPGEAVTVIVRPEAIQLDRAAGARAEPSLAWRGVVTQRFFRGARNLYTVEVGSCRFNVDAPPDQSFTTGATVSLSVAALHTWSVRD